MKNITLMFVFFIFSHIALADTTCKAPEPSAVIYFGNGINTTKQSAAVSLSRLDKELGADYNGHRLEYALAYNETSGMALDLAQASDQLAIQINSRLMLWFSGEGIAPGWLASWYQDYLLRKVFVTAKEVVHHANFYLNDILDGKKVIVVAHSQGNFYVNETKELLARQLRNGKISSLAIFGVAVPSDNTGGSKGPYLTNHRDFIQNVPQSLPANWKLHRSDRTDADNIGVINAHLFNPTYISRDFDIRPELVSGIKTQIDNAARPLHSCETYNSVVSSLVAGHYLATCGIKPNAVNRPFIITPAGMTLTDGRTVNTTGAETFVSLSQKPEATPWQIEFGAFGGPDRIGGGAGWDANRTFRSVASSSFCYVDEDTPPTSIGTPFSISNSMMSSVQSVYRLLPKGSCTLDQNSRNDDPIEFSVNGSQVRLGERTWQISADSEAVSTFNHAFKEVFAASYTDPGFLLSTDLGQSSVSISFTRNREIREFTAIEAGKSMVTCNFDQRNQRV